MQYQNMLPRSTGKVILMLVLLLTSLTSCKKENSETIKNDYRKIAWNQLSAEEKATVIVNWETAQVSIPSIEDPDAASVMFITNDGILGPIIVYISIKDKKVTSTAPRF